MESRDDLNKRTELILNTSFKLSHNIYRQLQITTSNNSIFFDNQLKKVFIYLQNCLATAPMVAAATKIPHKNICRYKRCLEIAGYLWQVENKNCKITGHKAWYLTTNSKYL